MQLITTKFFISPVPADYVPRPQLLKKLEQVSAHKLTLLSAPAGFGKTTLLSAWLRDAMDKTANHDGNSIKIQPCWLSLDTDDNEPGHFLEVLFASLEDSGVQLDAATAFLPIKDSVNYRPALNALVHDLSNSQNEIVLALDDYHVIENKEVHGFVHHLISRAQQSFHVLISTRAHPPLETGKLRASGQLLELGQADLRFTLEETREYLRQVQGLSLVEKDVVAIASKTEGWISGLKMAVLSMQKSEDPAAFVKALNGSHRYIFDYLMEQALAQQPKDVKEFLLKTSIVESFNASLCDALIQGEKYPPGASQKILTPSVCRIAPVGSPANLTRKNCDLAAPCLLLV
jgi:LuxR family maltose regulon positive regulatory protein